MLGFPWAKLAISQVKYLPIIQSASLFGSSFIGFIIIFFNGIILLAIINYKKDKILLLRPDDFVLYFGKDENILFEVMVGVSIGSINDIIKYDALLPASIICA